MSVASLEASDEPFLGLSQQVASSFVDIYLSQSTKKPDVNPRFVPRAPIGMGLVQDGEASDEDGAAGHSEDQAVRVARRLARIGDAIDDRVKEKMKEAAADMISSSSVFDVNPEQFTRVCRTILSRCSGLLRNGWEQIWVGYAQAGEITRQLRHESQQVHSQRERQVQAYVGHFMQDVGLDQWPSEDTDYPTVEIRETPVDEHGSR